MQNDGLDEVRAIIRKEIEYQRRRKREGTDDPFDLQGGLASTGLWTMPQGGAFDDTTAGNATTIFTTGTTAGLTRAYQQQIVE